MLVKPQFEAGREHVGKGGIVRDEAAQTGGGGESENRTAEVWVRQTEVIESPILGAEGNREFLLYGVVLVHCAVVHCVLCG